MLENPFKCHPGKPGVTRNLIFPRSSTKRRFLASFGTNANATTQYATRFYGVVFLARMCELAARCPTTRGFFARLIMFAKMRYAPGTPSGIWR